MLVVRGIQNCEFSGPCGPNGWRPLDKIIIARTVLEDIYNKPIQIQSYCAVARLHAV
jgi:hypothetical protein